MDPRIALGVQPLQIENPVNQLARVMQVQGMQQDQQLGRLKMDEYQRGITEKNRLASILQGGGDAEALRKGGFLKEALDWDKANADRAKASADTAKAQSEALTKRMNFYRERIPADPKGAAAWLAAQHNDDVLGPLMKRIGSLESDISTIPTDPQAFEQWRNQQALGMGEFLKANAPKYQTQDTGQVSSILALPGLGGAPQTVSSVQKVATPDARLSAETSTANNQRSVGASLANAQATRDAAKETGAATRDAARIQTGFQNEQGLRKEFEALPEVKKYKQALPSYKGIEDAVKRNTAQSDINIVYGIAKLYDPDSVVREGEYATVANSPNIPDRIKGYAQYLAGGGRLTPKVKAEILAEAKSRMTSFENEFTNARSNYESIAKRSNVDPTKVFPSPHTPAVGKESTLPKGWSVKVN